MEQYHRITKQLAYSYISNILIFLFGFLSVYFLTRYLTIEEYGAYVIISVTVEIVVVMLDLGFTQYLVTNISAMNYKHKIESLFSLMGFEIFLFILLNIIYFSTPIHDYILNLLKLENYSLEFNIAIGIIILALLIRVYVSYYAANKRLELQSLIVFLLRALWVIFIILFVFLLNFLNLFSAVLLWFLGILITLIITFFYSKKEFIDFIKIHKLNLSPIKKGVIFGMPLILYNIGTYVIVMADRYILNYYTTLSLVGIYALAYSICSMITSFGTTISVIIYPYIAEAWHGDKDHNLLSNVSLKYTLMLVIPAAIGIYVLREPIITLISGVNYINSAKIIPFLMWFPILSVIVFILYQNLLVRGKTLQIGLLYIIGGILNILLNIILIPYYGLYGAAITTVISYLFLLILMYPLCRNHLKINRSFIKIGRITGASAIMGAAIYFINPTIVWTKIITIAFGAFVYLIILFLFKTFSKGEIDIIKGFFSKSLLNKLN